MTGSFTQVRMMARMGPRGRSMDSESNSLQLDSESNCIFSLHPVPSKAENFMIGVNDELHQPSD